MNKVNAMRKKSKRVLFSLIFPVIAVILLLWGVLLYNWNTNPEAICNRAGGFWGPVSCENLCNKSQADYDCEAQPGHMDCTCGHYENQCWNGEKCVEISP